MQAGHVTTRQIVHEMCIIFHIPFIDYSYCSCMNFLQFHILNIFHTNFIKVSWKNPSMKHLWNLQVHEILTISWI